MDHFGKSGAAKNPRRKSMLKLNLLWEKKSPKILCLGAHSDDIEIGCGGTILKLLREAPEAQFYWVVFSAKGNRAKEANESAKSFLSQTKSKTIDIQDFRDSYFPFIGAEIKDYFEEIKVNFDPDVIFTHYSNDAHQDHRLISNLTWNTYRNHLILEYEIPKYDGDLVTPNLYNHIDVPDVDNKIHLLCSFFKTQKENSWFSQDNFRSIMRIRGVESNSQSGYAEAFHCRKAIL
jgi:LmbE family N-acetylglucosaminyl deacetylase